MSEPQIWCLLAREWACLFPLVSKHYIKFRHGSETHCELPGNELCLHGQQKAAARLGGWCRGSSAESREERREMLVTARRTPGHRGRRGRWTSIVSLHLPCPCSPPQSHLGKPFAVPPSRTRCLSGRTAGCF